MQESYLYANGIDRDAFTLEALNSLQQVGRIFMIVINKYGQENIMIRLTDTIILRQEVAAVHCARIFHPARLRRHSDQDDL